MSLLLLLQSSGEAPPPVETPNTNGGKLYADHMGPARSVPIIRRSSRVRGHLTLIGSAVGSHNARAAALTATTRLQAGSLVSRAHRTATLRGMLHQPELEHRCTTGQRDPEYLALYSELRRMQDERDLMLML